MVLRQNKAQPTIFLTSPSSILTGCQRVVIFVLRGLVPSFHFTLTLSNPVPGPHRSSAEREFDSSSVPVFTPVMSCTTSRVTRPNYQLLLPARSSRMPAHCCENCHRKGTRLHTGLSHPPPRAGTSVTASTKCVTCFSSKERRSFHLVPGGIRVVGGQRLCELRCVGTKALFVNGSRFVNNKGHHTRGAALCNLIVPLF